MRYILLLLVFACLKTGAQEVEILDQLAGKLLRKYTTESKELVAIQTDKNIYREGSQIWFRVYPVSGNGSPLSLESRIIFVDLVNNKDSVVDRVLLNADTFQLHGALRIPGNLQEGYYHLRAYTKKIIQDYPADIFVTPVYITNNETTNTAGPEAFKNNPEPIINFYPEGNNLVNGVGNVVYFTATDLNGNPVLVNGLVKDNRDTVVANFTGKGIGKFSFEPYSKDRTYKVYIKRGTGPDLVYPLPAINAGSYQLSLQQRTNNQLTFRVALGDSVYKKKAASYLLGVGGGTICFASSGSGMYMVNIPLNNFPSGIADFWLFDEKQELVSKRSVFIEKSKSKITISADRPEYFSRQKAKINISITDNEGKPVKAVMAVGITDNMLTGKRPAIHAAQVFLLSRNSTGFNPGEIISDKENNYLDMLASLAGSGNYLKKNPGITVDNNFYWDGLELKGKITDKQNAGLIRDLVILSPDQEKLTYQDSTDNTGNFFFRDIVFYGTQSFHVIVPAIYNKQKQYTISYDPLNYPVIQTAFFNSRVYPRFSKTFSDFKKYHADSVITGSTPQLLQLLSLGGAPGNKKSSGAKRLSSHRITAETLDKLGLSNTVDAVKMLPGIIMIGNRITITGGMPSLDGNLSKAEPLLLVDGVPANASSVVDYLNSLSPSNIEYIEVLTGPEAAMYGSRSANGVISVKMANQIRVNQLNAGKDHQTFIAKGYHKAPSFYIPPYDVDIIRETVFNDNRATLYWNGELVTGPNGKAEFSFYTADLKNDYTLTVQGVTEKGELIFAEYNIKRK